MKVTIIERGSWSAGSGVAEQSWPVPGAGFSLID
jgi:hypothetical protein